MDARVGALGEEADGGDEFDPWVVDASAWQNIDYERLLASGGPDIHGFCLAKGSGPRSEGRLRPLKTVLAGQRGLGKSFLLRLRSHNHREHSKRERTFFHPEGHKSRDLVESLTSLSGSIPDKHWLRSAQATEHWLNLWQIAIGGLLFYRLVENHRQSPAFTQYFGAVDALMRRNVDAGVADAGAELVPTASLQWFLSTLVESIAAGRDEHDLAELLFKAKNEWELHIVRALSESGFQQIAVYVDNPDELVSPSEAELWLNVQQGLLLAVWKFRKGGLLSEVLQVFASIRSEALLHRQHRDLQSASDIVLVLRYNADALRALFCHRIRHSKRRDLVDPDSLGTDPIRAFIGFNDYDHPDRRNGPAAQPLVEEVVEAIIRHTRMVPRDLVCIGARIRDIGLRGVDKPAIKKAVNTVARELVDYVKENSFPAWSPALDTILCSITSPVVDGDKLRKIAAQCDQPRGSLVHLQTLLSLGLIGAAVPDPRRHRHAYRQHFTYDARPEEADAHAPCFFVHPATKEWIKNYPNRVEPLVWTDAKDILFGHDLPYSAQAPRVLVDVVDATPFMMVNGRPILPLTGKVADPMKFLFLALIAWKGNGGSMRLRMKALLDIRTLIVKAYPTIALRFSVENRYRKDASPFIAKKLRDWAKKLGTFEILETLRPEEGQKGDARATGVISIESADGAIEPLIYFTGLAANDIDISDELGKVLKVQQP